MSSLMDIEVSDPLNRQCVHNSSWFENLSLGARALFLHPFLPFLESKFNLKCLFSSKPYCCAEIVCSSKTKNQNELDKQHSNQFKEHSYSILGKLFRDATHVSDISYSKHIDTHNFKMHKLYDSVTNTIKAKPSQVFLISQLILCIVLLSYFLLKDIKRIICYIRNR